MEQHKRIKETGAFVNATLCFGPLPSEWTTRVLLWTPRACRLFDKKCPCCHGKTGSIHSVTELAGSTVVNKAVKASSYANSSRVCALCILSSLGAEGSVLKRMKGIDQKKKIKAKDRIT